MHNKKKNKRSLKTLTQRVGVSALALMLLSGCALHDRLSKKPATTAEDAPAVVATASAAELEEWKNSTNPPILKAARRSGKAFFQITSPTVNKALPETSVPLLKYDQVYLSEALIQLLRDQNFKLFIDEDVTDSLLLDVTLSGTFSDALTQLAQKGNFFYTFDGDVLYIKRRKDFVIDLPPLGYLSKTAPEDSNARRFNNNENPYATLQNFMTGFGVRGFTINNTNRTMTTSMTPSALASVATYFDEIIREEGVIAYTVRVVRLITPQSKPIAWESILTQDGKAMTKVNKPFEGVAPDNLLAFSGAITPDKLVEFLKPLTASLDVIDDGLLMQLPEAPVTFSAGSHPYLELCNTPNNAITMPGLFKVTLQSALTNTAIDGRLYMELIQPKDEPERACIAPETQNKAIFATRFAANGRDTVVITGIRSPYWDNPLANFASKSPEFQLASKGFAEEYAMILEPQLIRLPALERPLLTVPSLSSEVMALPSKRKAVITAAPPSLPERISRNPFSSYRQEKEETSNDDNTAASGKDKATSETTVPRRRGSGASRALTVTDDPEALLRELDPEGYRQLTEGTAPVKLSRPAPEPVIHAKDSYGAVTPPRAALRLKNGVIVNPAEALKPVRSEPLELP